MSRRVLLFVGFVILFGVAVTARTRITIWDFRNQQVPGRWDVSNLTTAAPTQQGLHIKTETIGRLLRDSELTHGVDAIRITYLTGHNTDGILYWHIRGTPERQLVKFPFTYFSGTDEGGKTKTVALNVGAYDQWDRRADRIGLAFPVGTDLLLEQVELVGLSPTAKIVEAMKTFWTFDALRPYSINFLWGPLLTYSPVAREQLFHRQPPLANSGNHIFYIILAGGFVFLYVQRFRRVNRKRMQGAILWFLSMFAILWIIYDVRMGLEFMGYLRKDYDTYFSETLERRTFREHDHFYDFAKAITPFVSDRGRYIFMAQRRWPYLGLIRYITYPSIPTSPDRVMEGVDTWIIYERPDIIINENRQIVLDGEIISPPGSVLHEFGKGTFIFRTET